jgi:hypothetical protein
MNWTAFWGAWIALGVVGEGIALVLRARGTLGPTLTEFARHFVLFSPAGAMLIGAFLIWMVWHWLFDANDLGREDYFAVGAGVLIGLGGWFARKRSLEAQVDERSPPKAEDVGSSPIEGTMPR